MFERHKYQELSKAKLAPDALDNAVASIKYDGGNYMIHVGRTGNLRFISRRLSVTGAKIDKTKNLPHLANVKLPQFAGHVFNAELIHTGKDKNNIESHSAASGILNSLPQRAADTQKIAGPIRVVLFDVLHPKIETYQKKLEILKKVEQTIGKPEVVYTPEFVKGKSAIEKLIEETKNQNREGVIITRLDKPDYQTARIKIKHLKTYNLRVGSIIQEVDKNGKLKPSMGAMELIDAEGKVACKVGGGFTHELRKQIWENPKLWIGKLIQVRAQDPTAHKLRSPQYNGDADGELDTV